MLRDRSRPPVTQNGRRPHASPGWTRAKWGGRTESFTRSAPSFRHAPRFLPLGPEQPRLPRRFRHVVSHNDTTNAILYTVALLVIVGVCAVILLGGVPLFD
jgi:hypothetical protein